MPKDNRKNNEYFMLLSFLLTIHPLFAFEIQLFNHRPASRRQGTQSLHGVQKMVNISASILCASCLT
jgi:hypothetical protein